MKVIVADGKYTVVLPDSPEQALHVLRYGKEWRTCIGDNLVLALATELQEAREALKFYSNPADWYECIAQGEIGENIHDGEPMMVFEPGEDHPWKTAKEALDPKN